jgi:UDP-N-acetylmuramoyl-tripeptide--D-alanyl-D-alanine ligase
MDEIYPEKIAASCNGQWHPRMPVVPQRALCVDSRLAKFGSLFFALEGERADGHDFLPQIADACACAVIREDFPVAHLPATGHFLRVASPLKALGDLAAATRIPMSARVVGVTGSVGKTCTKELIADLLSVLGKTVRTQGNFNNEIGLPLSLAELTRDCAYGVFEAGISHPGEMARLRDILKPDIVVMTPIGKAHIEHFASVEAIAEEKAILLEQLPPDGFAVLDRDDACFDLLQKHGLAPVVTCSMQGSLADYMGEEQVDGRLRVVETATGESALLPVPPPGAFMAGNVLQAVAVARRCGAAWDALATALGTSRPVGMRWAVEEVGEWTVINDGYNANPVSMHAALKAFAAIPNAGRRFLALGPMLELGQLEESEHEVLGRFVAEGPWAGIVMMSNSSAAAAQAVRTGLLSAGWPEDALKISMDSAEAAAWLRERMRARDVLLLKASRSVRIEEVLNELKKEA